ncbi:MAG TPA: helix-turn-helix domain-containing protein [Thermoflexia bacterium]|jgi:cytoskeletal protein RodZ|nr:helix-turn-helix domain-containing protein [Thermoflexia bacterium]
MGKLGEWLRTAREAKGLSLEDVERVTRIRVRSLAALERGDYEALTGGEPQVRGFLRRYAAFLGLSPEEAISRYEREVYGAIQEGSPVSPSAPKGTASFSEIDIAPRRLGVLPLLAGAGVLLLLGLIGWWFLFGFGTPISPTPTPVVSQAASVLPSPQAVAPSVEPAVTPTFPVAAGGGVTLTLEPLEHVWVRVTTDGLTAFEGLLSPDAPQTWTARELVVVETGNGAGVVAVVNGQEMGPLGGRGEVCVRGWGPRGEVDLPAGPLGGEGEAP